MYREVQERMGGRSRSRERRAVGDPDPREALSFRQLAFEENITFLADSTGICSTLFEKGSISSVILDTGCSSSSWSSPVSRNFQLRKHANASKKSLDFTTGNMVPVEENSFDLEFRRHISSKKGNRTPIKALIDREISKEMEIRCASPSLVVRLMGLDTLPPAVTKKQKERGVSSQNTSSVELHKKHLANEGYPLHMSSSEYQECKDVFEVMEMPNVEKQNGKPFRNRVPSLEQSEIDLKPSNIDWAFTKQKSMDTTHLSTDDEFRSSKEYNDAVEDLDPNKDLFVKFLQEPSSLFKKHLQDVKCSPPSPHANHITILKPSIAKAEKNAERHPCFVKGDISSCRRPVCNLVGHSVKERSSSLPHKPLEQLHTGKSKVRHSSTQIVVLKPSLEKAWDMETTVPLPRYPENHQYGLKRQKGIPISRRSEVYAGRGGRHKLSDSVEVMGHKAKGLREIARDVTKQLRTAGSSGSKTVAASKNYGQVRDESSFGMLGMESLDIESLRWTSKKYGQVRDESSFGMLGMESLDIESLGWTFDQLHDCGDSLSAASYYSTESSVSREARKHLSERWKMIQRIQAVGPVDKRSSTLGEMLVSDRETLRNTLNTSVVQNISGGKVARGEVLARWDYPLSNSSNDGWKEGWSRNVSRSKSLPASSLVYGNHVPSRRNRVGSDNSNLENLLNKSPNDLLVKNVGQKRKPSIQSVNYRHTNTQFTFGREETEMSEREIHVNSEEICSRIYARQQTGVADRVPELSDDSVAGGGHEGGNLAPQCEDAKFPLIVDYQQVQQPTKLAEPVNDGEFSGADPNYLTRKEISVNHPHVNPVSSHCDVSESPSPARSKEDQPSPVSVLEPSPSEEDKSSSECFEKISAGLKELRMQLRLLKLESADTDAEDLELLISSDEDSGECRSPLYAGETLEAFRDDEDRDFSYLLDVLIDSGVHHTSANGLFNACYAQEYPVGREVFEKLEKKYNVLVSWSRSERKLLFDLISSILADVISPSIDLQSMKSRRCHPTWSREGLFEDVWQLVVKQRKELGGKQEEKLLLEPRWLDFGGEVYMVGKELESMLIDGLMEELLSQLI